MVFERAHRQTRQIAMTPLIDVVFLLLVFFMLSTSFVRTESIELTLPAVDSQPQAPSTGKVLRIYVTNEGEMFIGRQSVTEQRLQPYLQELLADTPDRQILLLAGKQVSVQLLVTMMDRIYQAGGKNLAVLNWEPAQGGSP